MEENNQRSHLHNAQRTEILEVTREGIRPPEQFAKKGGTVSENVSTSEATEPEVTEPEAQEPEAQNDTTEAQDGAAEKTADSGMKVGPLHKAHAQYIKDTYGIDISPEQVFAVYQRVAFRRSEAYRVGVRLANEQARREALETREADRVRREKEREAEKARKAEEAEAKRAAREAERARKQAEEDEAKRKAAEAAAEKEGQAAAEGADVDAAGATASKKRGGKKAPATAEPKTPAPF